MSALSESGGRTRYHRNQVWNLSTIYRLPNCRAGRRYMRRNGAGVGAAGTFPIRARWRHLGIIRCKAMGDAGLFRERAAELQRRPMPIQQMQVRLLAAQTFEKAVTRILDDVIALHGAEFGNVQLPVGDELVIAAQRGFGASFLKKFERVRRDDDCACGRALRDGQIVVIPDVQQDEEYAPFREIAREAGYRAVQSTPLFATTQVFVGIVSTHFANVHRPTKIEMETLTQYGVIAANRLHELAGGSLSSKALAMSRKVAEFA